MCEEIDMAKADIWMPLYIGDYLADTMELSTEQHGAYLLLLMAYWKNGGALSSDPRRLAAIARMPLDAWSNAQAMLESFFDTQTDPALWIHERAEEEIQKAGVNSEKQRLRAEKAAAARWGKNAPSNAQGMLEDMHKECPSPSPSYKELKEPSLRSGKKSSPKGKPVEKFELPAWIGTEAWESFVHMRKSIKKPMTDNAMRLAVRELEKLDKQGHRADDVLNQSTLHSWQGLFPIKQGFTNDRQARSQATGNERVSLVEKVRRANAHLLNEPEPPEFHDEREWPEFDGIREVNGQVVDADDRDVRPQMDQRSRRD